MIKQKFIYIKELCDDRICLNCKYFYQYITGAAECTLFCHPLNLIYITNLYNLTEMRERTYKRLDICKESQIEESAILNILNGDPSGIYFRISITFNERLNGDSDCYFCNFSRGTSCKIFNKSDEYRCKECTEAENL